MKMTGILSNYFNKGEGKRPATEFLQELKKLSPDEKKELATLAATELDVPCDDCK